MERADSAYQVLARKWRPQAFSEVSGQEHVVRTLRNAVAAGRVAHAYLFCGPRGVGKTTAARLLARALQCEKGPTADPCGSCQACVEIAAGSSVDVAEIDGASNNGVDDVRAIRENARYLPTRDRHKIYIIDEVHMLSQAAFNALLKTLEEPPPHVKFIFATTEAHKVPDTIVSRCQLHTFRRIPLAAVVEKLRQVAKAEGFGLDDAALSLIARQAAGGMRDALSMLDQVVASCGTSPTAEAVAEALGAIDRRAVAALAGALCRRDAGAVVALLAEQHARGQEPKRVAEALCQQLRDLVVFKATGAPPAELPDHEQKELAAIAGGADAAQLARLFDLVHCALGELSRAFEPELALEVALLKGVYLAPGAQLSELIARVEALGASPLPRDTHPLPREAGEDERGGGRGSAVMPPHPSPPPQAGEGVLPAGKGALAARERGSSRTAAAPPSPAPAPLPHGDDPSRPPEARLEALVAAVATRSPRIGTALKNGRLASIAPGELSLGYPKGDFRAALLMGERKEVEALLSGHFGAPTALRIVEHDGAGLPPSIAEREAKATSEREAAVKAAATGSEAVREALRVFGAQVEEVRVLGVPGDRK